MMKHQLRFTISNFAPRIAKTIFFLKYKRAMENGRLPVGWKENEIFLLPVLLKKDSVFFDVGANVGIYTYIASRLTAVSNVHCFEPMPNYFRALRAIFSNCHVNELAMSSSSGHAVLKIPSIEGKKFTSRATLNKEFKENKENSSELVKVQTMTLDDYCEANEIERIDLIKIDVEGHENSVLDGFMSSIEKYRPAMIIEIEQRHHAESVNSTIRTICEKGYQCFYLGDNPRRLIELDSFDTDLQNDRAQGTSSYINNFLFLPDGHIANIDIRDI